MLDEMKGGAPCVIEFNILKRAVKLQGDAVCRALALV